MNHKQKKYEGLNESVVVHCAVRYALGRCNYAPRCVIDFCRENWHELSEKARLLIMVDILEWLGDRHNWATKDNDIAYPDEWRALLKWCFEQNPNEAKFVVDRVNANAGHLKNVDEFLGWEF